MGGWVVPLRQLGVYYEEDVRLKGLQVSALCTLAASF